MRRPLIAGNWKMHKTPRQAAEFVTDFKKIYTRDEEVEILLCPPFTALEAVIAGVGEAGIGVGAQNMYWKEQGAYTGEVSPVMLKAIGCSYVILGHSERRQIFGESDADVNKKIKAAFNHGLVPIVCVGETLQEREADKTREKVKTQVLAALDGLESDQVEQLVIAYEPIWAIGTGKTASAADAQQVIAYIRNTVQELTGVASLRILYGGSVKPGNVVELMAQDDIDGALVGGASLEPDSFAALAGYRNL